MASRPTGGTGLSTEALAFLQLRVARFGRFTGLLFLVGYLFRAVLGIRASDWWFAVDPSMITHLLAVITLLGMWVICRRGQHSRRVVEAVELVGVLGAATALSVMGLSIPLTASPELIVNTTLLYIIFARAIYVPSTARRTFFIGLLMAIPLLITTWINWINLDPSLWGEPKPLQLLDAQGIATLLVTTTSFYWFTGLAICTAASKVIYGLRKTVRTARQLGQYTLDEKLGEGGMGAVYRAHHAMLRRPTAVKLLLPEKVGEGSLARFEQEVQLTANLNHPNTVTVFDYGRTPEGVFYYAMELLDGATLDAVVEVCGPQEPARVIHILVQVAGALAEAHGIGLIHRDIKPANIIVGPRGGNPDMAKVVDFGLVKSIETDEPSITQTQAVVGTPLYLSPEAITDPEHVDGRSDLYSLGAVAYFLLTGQHLFGGNSAMDICLKHVSEVPIRPSDRLGGVVPTDLEQLVMACLAKDPAERPESAAALLRQLETLKDAGTWDGTWWWEEYGTALQQSRAESTSQTSSERTFGIDLEARLANG